MSKQTPRPLSSRVLLKYIINVIMHSFTHNIYSGIPLTTETEGSLEGKKLKLT